MPETSPDKRAGRLASAATSGASTGVQSVHRSIDVLEALAAHGGAMPIGDLAEHTGLALPTAHRLLRTLLDRGHVRQLPDRRYALGVRLLPLGQAAGTMLGAGSDRLLARLVDALGETANLAMLDGDQVAYVAQAPGRHAMRMFTEVGRRVDPHCTAVGKAALALLPEAEARAIVGRSGLTHHTEHTLTSVEDLLAELAVVRERGYALDEEEQEVGVRCVAVAVPDSPARLGVSVSGPAPRMTDALVAEAVPLLRATAASLGRSLR